MTDYYHVLGPARTIEGVEGLRIDADVDHAHLPRWVNVVIDDTGKLAKALVVGSDSDGWPVVADPWDTSAPDGTTVHPAGPIGMSANGRIRGLTISEFKPLGEQVWVLYEGEAELMTVIAHEGHTNRPIVSF